MIVKIKLLSSYAVRPFYATEGSSGLDLCSSSFSDIVVKPFSRELIPTGVSVEMPVGVEAQIRSRSGIALKSGVIVLNSPGTIDSDYRGEIGVILMNLSNEDFLVKHGMKIAQMVFQKFEKVDIEFTDVLSNTARGSGGFGSTGI